MAGQLLSVTTDDGLTLVGEVHGLGTRQLALLLHGGGQSRHAWAGTVDRLLAAGFDVASYDARGHGDSSWAPDKDYSHPAYARDLIAFLGALGRPAVLIGASLGGVTALFAAADAPALIDGLVLVDIVPRFAAEGVERVRSFMTANPEGFATIEEALEAVQAYNPNRSRPKDPSNLRRSLREGADGRLRWHWDPAVVGDAPTMEMTRLFSDKLAALPRSLPLMLLAGAQSDVVDEAAVATFRKQAPHAEIHSVDRAGHMVAGDRNDAFSTAIIDFLRRHARPETGLMDLARRHGGSADA